MQVPEGKVCRRTENRSRNPRVFPCAPGKVARDRQDAAAACRSSGFRIWSKNECGSWALGFLPIVVLSGRGEVKIREFTKQFFGCFIVSLSSFLGVKETSKIFVSSIDFYRGHP